VFTSTVYPYSITLPAGWTVYPATAAWDGRGAPGDDAPDVDLFRLPLAASAFAFAAPTKDVLKAYVNDAVARNARFHGDTCPAEPESIEPVKIGDESGALISWNCGILINLAVTVHAGTGFHFVFRDPAVHAATNAADKATFTALLSSVSFR
jgi:hypothetical protein